MYRQPGTRPRPPRARVRSAMPRRWLLAAIVVALAKPLAAQQLELSAGALAVWHHADRTPEGRSRAELSLVRPVAMARWRPSQRLAVRATVNLEGLTIPAGELAIGGIPTPTFTSWCSMRPPPKAVAGSGVASGAISVAVSCPSDRMTR